MRKTPGWRARGKRLNVYFAAGYFFSNDFFYLAGLARERERRLCDFPKWLCAASFRIVPMPGRLRFV